MPGAFDSIRGTGFIACLLAASLLVAEDNALEIFGLVVDERERAAADVEIEIIVSDMRIRRPIGREVTRSSALGDFHFDLTEKYASIPRIGLDFRTASPRFRQVTRIKILTQDEFPLETLFVLPTGISARGLVKTEDGDPVAGAVITGGDDRRVETDEEGRFWIYGLIPGRRNAIRVSGAGIAGTMTVVEAPEYGSIEDLVIVVPTSTAIGGIVFDPGGNPVTEGLVTATLENANRFWRDHIDGEGRFEFRSIPLFSDEEERLILRAWSPGFVEAERILGRSDIDTPQPVHLNLTWGVKLMGTVMDGDANRSGGGMIVLGDGRHTRRVETPVDEAGFWKAGPVRPGEHITLTALPPRPRQGTYVTDVQFDDQRGHIERWTYGPSSVLEVEELDGSKIRLIRHDHGPGSIPGRIVYQGTVVDDWQRIEGSITVEATGSSGTFFMRPHHGGRRLRGDWELRETLEGGTTVAAPTQRRISVSPLEGTQVIEMHLDRPESISGTAFDPAGRTLRSGSVRLQEWNRTFVHQVDAPIGMDGTFLLEGLPRDGVLTIQLLDASRTPIAEPVYLRPGVRDVMLHAGTPPEDPVLDWEP